MSALTFNVGNDEIKVSETLIRSISYQEVNEKVFQPKCIGCHGSSGGVNLETYKSASSHLEGIKNSTVVRRTMPRSPVKALTKNELELVAAWVAAGGPETPLDGSTSGGTTSGGTSGGTTSGGSTSGGSTGEGPVIEPTYVSIKKQIIDRKCLSCHTAGGSAHRMPFNTREELLDDTYEVVIPNNPDDSGMLIVLAPDARKPMPPKDSGFSAVTESEKAVIREWILKGAP